MFIAVRHNPRPIVTIGLFDDSVAELRSGKPLLVYPEQLNLPKTALFALVYQEESQIVGMPELSPADLRRDIILLVLNERKLSMLDAGRVGRFSGRSRGGSEFAFEMFRAADERDAMKLAERVPSTV